MYNVNSGYDYVDNFINTLAPIVCEVYLQYKNEGKRVVNPSVVLAQASVESGYNLDASTIFGIKGEGNTLHTSEYINGEYVEIEDSFLSYASLTDAVYQYFELMQWDNYNRVTETNDSITQCKMLSVCGYATSPTYSDTLIDVIQWLNLTEYDEFVNNYVVCENADIITEETTNDDAEEITNDVKHAQVITDACYNVYDCNGVLCRVWYDCYDVVDINDNGVCLAKEGTIFARIPIENVKFID